ncbi:MAG: hypothetical protein Unbinned3138contig1001_8 [Prokaryotic dsDNA virus sp.]|nr:MAG: hypothetical protein Unbinned3138contig1001_8 [Prokaryotic dsDNA virus sp.]|tara:strand:+ start:5387 stop:6256 length:870 start_codon:yes stop_codon:yes gene_type:complete
MNYPMSIEQTARHFVQSGMFPDLKSEEQAATLLIIGRGFNISDYDSVTGLYLRQGKVNMHANVMASAIKASGKYDYEVRTNTDQLCEIQFFRVDGSGRHPLGEHSFSMAQAQRANLTKNFTWKQYPEAMLFARCISAGYRAHCPDALGAAPVYVEQHGELEVDDPSSRNPPPAQRAVPEQPEESTVVDEPSEPKEVPIRVALINEIQGWSGMNRDDTVRAVVKMLSELGLPTDGTCDDIFLGYILVWARDCKQKKVDWPDAHDAHFEELIATVQKEMEPVEESEDDIEF